MDIKNSKVAKTLFFFGSLVSVKLTEETLLDTLIVWTEPTGIDMALSFQEAEGCASIWYDLVFLASNISLPP